jgi:hypothetical protein
VRGGREQRA